MDTVQEPGSNLKFPMLIGAAVVILFAVALLYFWPDVSVAPSYLSDSQQEESWMPSSTGSDEAAAIQAELESTNMAEFENSMNADANAAASGI